MLISVIIPVYKTEKYLRQCIDSVLSQSFKDLEVILVDDGSPDSCPAICDTYAETCPKVKVIHQENGGAAAARNAGIRASCGEYLIFLDSDDRWQGGGRLEKLVEAMTARQADVIGFTAVSISALNGRVRESSRSINIERISGRPKLDALEYMRRTNNLFSVVWRVAVRRLLVIENGIWFPEGLIAEDYDWLAGIICHMKSIDYVKEDLVAYRIFVTGSITSTVSVKSARSILTIAEKWDVKLKTERIDCPVIVRTMIGNALVTIFSQLGFFDKQERKQILRGLKKYKAMMRSVPVLRYRAVYGIYRMFGAAAAWRLTSVGVRLRRWKLYGR